MRRLALVGFALLVVISGCGGGGVNKEELARSVAQTAEQELTHMRAVVRRYVPGDQSGPLNPYRIRVIGKRSCIDARSGAPSPRGTTAKYSCFYSKGEPGAPRSERIFFEANVYSVSGNCWKAVMVESEFGVGTMAFEETTFSQRELDEAWDRFSGCIGEESPQASSQAPKSQSSEETTQPAPPPSSSGSRPAVIAEAGKPARVEPLRFEISGGTQPLIIGHIHWKGWGRSIAYGNGELEVPTCTPDCASGNYEPQGPAQLQLALIETSECGQPLYMQVHLTTKQRDDFYRLSCAGLAQTLNH